MIRKVALITTLATLVVAPAAHAGKRDYSGPPPKPADPTIVPLVSVGGVKTGMQLADADAAWGGTGGCGNFLGQPTCRYGSTSRGAAMLSSPDSSRAVALVELNAPVKNGEFSFKGPLMKFVTEKGGIGLGDRGSQLMKQYPEGKNEFHAVTYQQGPVRMVFGINGGRIISIFVYDRSVGSADAGGN